MFRVGRSWRIVVRKAVVAGVTISAAASATTSMGTAAAAANKEKAPASVSVAVSGTINSMLTPQLNVAMGEGCFDRVGRKFKTTINFKEFATGPLTAAALTASDVQLAFMGTTEGTLLAAQGVPVRGIMATQAGTLQLEMVALSKYKSNGTGIKALKAFQGKTWGVNSVGGSVDLTMKALAQSLGINWGAQTVVATGSLGATAAALTAGRIDIAPIDPIGAAQLISQGTVYGVLNFTGRATSSVFGDFVGGSFVGRTDFLTSYPKLSAALTACLVDAMKTGQKFADEPAKVFKVLTPEMKAAITKPTFVAAWPILKPFFTDTEGLFGENALRDTTTYLRSINRLRATDSIPAQYFDNSVVKQAYRDLGLSVPKETTATTMAPAPSTP